MLKVNFANGEIEYEDEISADKLRILNDLKPTIYLDGNDYKIVSLQYNVEHGSFTVHIEKDE